MKEGFVKIEPINSFLQLKNYFFYLTHSNRSLNLPTTNPLPLDYNKEFNVSLKFSPNKSFMHFYSKWRETQKKEWVGNKVKAHEMVFSYSKLFNHLLLLSMSEKEWENTYTTIVENILNKRLALSKGWVSFYHKQDKTGYRLHCHTLIYPYNYGTQGSSALLTIPRTVLALIKKDFENEADKLLLIHRRKINIELKKLTNSPDIDDELFFKIFIDKKSVSNKFISKLWEK